MLTDWRGDEEDSLGIEDRRRRAKPDAPLQIAVVRLPFISNYTDFDALADEPDVNVRYVNATDELEGAAAIVLPGTKSTIADLAWLRRSGMATAVTAAGRRRHARDRRLRRLPDARAPHQRSRERRIRGRDRRRPRLLDAETTFAGDKRTVRVDGELLGGPLGPASTPLHGYENRMGRTVLGSGAAPLLRLRGADGSAHDDGAVAAPAPRARRRRPSAAATSTASSTIRRCAPPS